nr:aldo/keto reductase [Secundilactobacillus kimchicus]
MTIQEVTLNNGISMPLEGFGVFQVDDLKGAEEAVQTAINKGYRLIDTASSYKNETAVGQAISKSGVDRQDLFITTKAYIQQMGYRETIRAFYESLEKLQLDYLDLYLIHMPFGDYYGSWRAMIDLYKEGKIRAIGVSNFDSSRLIDLANNFDVIPAVNQIEHHPHFQRPEELKVMADLGIQPEAWAPFAEGLNGMFDEQVLKNIAESHGKSVPQIILRWNVQNGVVVIPKSVHENRMIQNLAIWDFELTTEEQDQIATLDKKVPSMLDINEPSEVKRVYDYLEHPVLTSLG